MLQLQVTAATDDKTYGDFRSSQAAEILPPLGNFAELKFWQIYQIICQKLEKSQALSGSFSKVSLAGGESAGKMFGIATYLTPIASKADIYSEDFTQRLGRTVHRCPMISPLWTTLYKPFGT